MDAKAAQLTNNEYMQKKRLALSVSLLTIIIFLSHALLIIFKTAV